jgi:hypothetical protein
VWGLLDTGDFLAAAHRVVGAECVHRQLAAARSQGVLSRQFKLRSLEEAYSEQTQGDIVAKADAVAATSGNVDAVCSSFLRVRLRTHCCGPCFSQDSRAAVFDDRKHFYLHSKKQGFFCLNVLIACMFSVWRLEY